jgi:hypothetical protein
MGEMRNEYRILARKHEGNRPHMTSRRIPENNIRMDLKDAIGYEVME